MPSSLARIALVPAVLLAASAAPAADGVLEINQACATATGCFIDDKPGFPVTITDLAPGKSFRLTSDLVVETVNDTAISVRTASVQIDLAGFTVRGPVTCSGNPTVCSASGTGQGVAVNASAVEALEVRNGVVTGMGLTGVSVGTRGVVESVRAVQNAGIGISVATGGGAVRDCISALNGSTGIAVGAGGLVSGSVAVSNGSNGLRGNGEGVTLIGNTTRSNAQLGISTTPGALVKDNVSTLNRSLGIETGGGSTIAGNTVKDNLADGIVADDGSTIADNTVASNGDAINEDGIACGLGCAVHGNTVTLNQGIGIRLGASSAYRENVVVDNLTGPVIGGVNRGSNHCAGTGTVAATCP